MTAHTLESGIKLAPTAMIADALRDSILREVEHCGAEDGDAGLDALRDSASQLAALALGAGWHDPHDSFSRALNAATRSGVPAANARGILIAAFEGDYCRSSVAAHGDGDEEQCAIPIERAFIIETRREMASARGRDRLPTFQRIAIEYGARVDTGDISPPDAAELLMDMAQSSGLSDELRSDDLQHLISEAMRGRTAIALSRQDSKSIATASVAKGRRLLMECAADITLKPIEWLWPQRIACAASHHHRDCCKRSRGGPPTSCGLEAARARPASIHARNRRGRGRTDGQWPQHWWRKDAPVPLTVKHAPEG